MARFKIGDIIKIRKDQHCLILDIRSAVEEYDRYDYIVLEKGYIRSGIVWWVDKNSEWIS